MGKRAKNKEGHFIKVKTGWKCTVYAGEYNGKPKYFSVTNEKKEVASDLANQKRIDWRYKNGYPLTDKEKN